MRVHHIVSNYSMYMGGAERVVRALHNGLLKRNIESFVFGLMAQADERLDGALSLGLKSPYELHAFLGVQRYTATNIKPDDIIHVHLFPPVFYVSLLKMLGHVSGHLVCTEHSTSNRRRGTLTGRLIDSVTYAGYERVIAISHGVEQELLKWEPRLRGKTRVIHNGVNLPFNSMIEHSSKRPLKVLSVGNLRSMKNYDNALKAVAMLKHLDFEYRIAGKGECREELLRLCKELDIESRVYFLGYVEPATNLFASADIFLMPSKWEGFGLSALEAMNASLPLVVSDIAGLREIVNSDPPCALLVDPDSPESIAQRLQQFLSSPELRLQYGRNAFKQAQLFSVDRMVESYINLYAEFN